MPSDLCTSIVPPSMFESSELTLPCILGRLSKLENDDFSYGQLLDGCVGRRRIRPLLSGESKTVATRLVANPAEETDAVVQVRTTARPRKSHRDGY